MLDELEAGTDPGRVGAEAALLDHLVRRRITTLATTHYSELKIRPWNTRRATPASSSTSVAGPDLRPRHRPAGSSNALAIAGDGVVKNIIDAAQSLVRRRRWRPTRLLQRSECALRLRKSGQQRPCGARQTPRNPLKAQLDNIEQTRRGMLNQA